MTKPDALLTRLSTYNPVPPNAGPPEGAWSATACLDEIENRSGTMVIEARFEPAPGQAPEPQKSPRRRVGATAGTVVLAAGLAVVWAQQPGSDEAPVITQPDPTPTTVATTIDPSSFLTWFQLPHDAAVFGGEGDQVMRSVTVGGPGLVAVGMDGSIVFDDEHEYESGDAAVWTSPDGITWSRVPHDEVVFGGGGRGMLSVTAGGPGLVAVGKTDSGAAVWTSVDGITWSRVPHDEAVFGFGEMSSVTVGGPGLVAVGTDYGSFVETDQGRFENPRATVWTSSDGITWSRVRLGLGGLLSVTAGGPGLVAVGYDGGPGDARAGGFRGNGAVWTSPDGITWTRVPRDETASGGGEMSNVTVGGPGLVAVGTEFEDRAFAAVWTSPDGITWTRGLGNEVLAGGGMLSVTAGGPGLVAVGEGAAVWTSVDGIDWSRDLDEAVFGAPGGRSQRLMSVTYTGSDLVAVGGADSDAAVWVAVPED